MSSCAIPERRDVEWRVRVGDDVRSSIEALFASQKTLEDVVRWGLGMNPIQLVKDVVVQDEYTHDVVMQHPSGVWLVYDTT
ncbi:MAG: hypothetical protein IPM54_12775 [Polyangiaceae bacterium]|nr:hypothetical protein [Polyangiaceae bacterium]